MPLHLNRDEPLRAAAELLLTTAPALGWAARRWATDDYVDWDALLDEWRDVAGAKSGGEQRLIAAVVQLREVDVWGLDAGNFDALAAALRIAAELVQSSADACRKAEDLFAAAVSA